MNEAFHGNTHIDFRNGFQPENPKSYTRERPTQAEDIFVASTLAFYDLTKPFWDTNFRYGQALAEQLTRNTASVASFWMDVSRPMQQQAFGIFTRLEKDSLRNKKVSDPVKIALPEKAA